MDNSIYSVVSYSENPTEIILKINSGDFSEIEYKLYEFEIYPHTPLGNNIGYNYQILKGEIPINKGEEFISLTKEILKSIIIRLHNKEVLIEST